MLTDFNTLPPHARVWIYQANRELTTVEAEQARGLLEEFLSQWTAHGTGLEAGFDIRYDRFIIISLNQDSTSASGCSIDTSVNFIRQLGEEFGVDFLDRANITYRDGSTITHCSLGHFKKRVHTGEISGGTIVFNNLVRTKVELEKNWEVRATESWHGRFVK